MNIGRKGSMLDLFWVLAAIFIMAFTIFISYNVVKEFHKGSKDIMQENANNTLTHYLNIAGTGYNYFYPFLIATLFFTSLIWASLSRGHPAMLFFSLFLLGVAVLLSFTFSNTFTQFINNSAFQEEVSKFNIIVFIQSKLPYIILVGGLILIIVLYMKSRENEGL